MIEQLISGWKGGKARMFTPVEARLQLQLKDFLQWRFGELAIKNGQIALGSEQNRHRKQPNSREIPKK